MVYSMARMYICLIFLEAGFTCGQQSFWGRFNKGIIDNVSTHQNSQQTIATTTDILKERCQIGGQRSKLRRLLQLPK